MILQTGVSSSDLPRINTEFFIHWITEAAVFSKHLMQHPYKDKKKMLEERG